MEVKRLRGELKAAKSEIGKLRDRVRRLENTQKTEMRALQMKVQRALGLAPDAAANAAAMTNQHELPSAELSPGSPVLPPCLTMRAISVFESCWAEKNGCPRQGRANPTSWGQIKLQNGMLVDGLEAFSHVWLLWWFHLNTHKAGKAKVLPPRLPPGTPKQGVLATRSPHRPNSIGLSLVKVISVEQTKDGGAIVTLGEVDLVNGTPIFDIKPYNPWCDSVEPVAEVRLPDWLSKQEMRPLSASFTSEAEAQLAELCSEEPEGSGGQPRGTEVHELRPATPSEATVEALTRRRPLSECREAIVEVLCGEPRSKYRRSHCAEGLYVFPIGHLDVECTFDDDNATACVVAVRARRGSASPLV
jgi:tRNA-Thr(GGU) m(6)t(6)A37 methyltransferase TsaA